MCAVEFDDADLNMKIINACIEKGVIVDWFLHCTTAMRIAPPLTISNKELRHSLQIIAEVLDSF